MPDTWSSTFASAKFSLSTGDATATATDLNHTDTIIGNQGYTTGKYYFELLTTASSQDTNYGIATATQTNSAILGNNTTSLCWRVANQNWRYNAAETASTMPIPTAGNYLGFAVDLTNGKIWIRNATTTPGTWYGNGGTGDPVAGTNGFAFTPFSALTFLGFTSNQNGVNEAVTMKTASFQFIAPPPSGFSDWYPTQGAFFYDRVQETTTTTGAGTITLSGAGQTWWTFLSSVGATFYTYYTLISGDNTNWECGQGTVKSGTLARDIVTASSNANSWISLAGTSRVFITPTNAATPNNKVIYPQFPNSTASTLGDTNVYVSSSSYSVAEGDAYRFQLVGRANGGLVLQIMNSTKDKGYRLIYQGDGNLVMYSWNVSNTVLRASGSNTAVFITNTECIISGEIAFSANYNWIHWPGAGAPVNNNFNNWVGSTFFVGIGSGTALLSNIKGCTFTKI